MKIFLYMVLALIMLIILIQDLKYRAIHYGLIISLLIIGILLWTYYSKEYQIILGNVLFLIFTLLGLKLYNTLTKKKKIEGFR